MGRTVTVLADAVGDAVEIDIVGDLVFPVHVTIFSPPP